ncbi:MAG: GyrI-like domain-containing protein [Pseudomonadota bacterium]
MSIERIQLPDQHYLYVDREAAADGSDIADAMGSGFGEVFAFVDQHGIETLSMPAAIYVDMPSPDGMFFRLGFFIKPADVAAAAGTIKAGIIPQGETYKAVHVGPYPQLHQTHQAIWKQMDDDGVERGRPVWEVYIDDPMETEPASLRTEVFRAVG